MNYMFQAPSMIESISTRKDGTMKLVVGTQELPSDQKAVLMDLHNKIGWFLFSEADITLADIPEEKPEFSDRKSDSQRLRNVLYVYWNKAREKGKINKSFEQVKHEWYERKIEQIKQSIDEL